MGVARIVATTLVGAGMLAACSSDGSGPGRYSDPGDVDASSGDAARPGDAQVHDAGDAGDATVKSPGGGRDPAFGLQVLGSYGREGRALALLADGRIVVAGVQLGDSSGVVARYLPDGGLDPSFGQAATGSVLVPSTKPAAIVAGVGDKPVFTNDRTPPTIARLAADGSLDSSFGAGGAALTQSTTDNIKGLSTDGDGYLVGGDTARPGAALGERDMALFRYAGDGTFDAAFGTSGAAKHQPSDTMASVRGCAGPARQGSGKWLVACGLIRLADLSVPGVLVVRFLADGSLDGTFGTAGESLVATLLEVGALAVQADGAVLLAGTGAADARVVRLGANGAPDGSFATGGGIDLGPVMGLGLGTNSRAAAVKIDASKRVLVAGVGGPAKNLKGFVARLAPGGTLDSSFGYAGSGVVRLGDVTSAVSIGDLAVRPDGAIYVTGWVSSPFSGDQRRLFIEGLLP